LASALQFPDSVLEIAPLEIGTKTLQVGVGFATHQDAIWAAVRATAMARAGLQGASAEMVLLVTAGVPSQDTMPRGGFGNLIALPLQHGPRALGNSVFVDDQMCPYPDDQQWSYLASLPRIDAATVEMIAREATERGSVVGMRIAAIDDRLHNETHHDNTSMFRRPGKQSSIAGAAQFRLLNDT